MGSCDVLLVQEIVELIRVLNSLGIIGLRVRTVSLASLIVNPNLIQPHWIKIGEGGLTWSFIEIVGKGSEQ